MTGFSLRNYGHCTRCGAGLRLGTPSPWLAFPYIVAIIAICVCCVLFLRDAIPFFPIVLPVAALILAFPLGFLLAYFHRGVELNGESQKNATQQTHAPELRAGPKL